MELTPRDKRILQIAGVVLLLLLIVYLFVLRPDDGGDLAQLGPTGTTDATVAPTISPSLTPSPTPRETLPPVSLAGSRDPFSIPPGLELTGGGVSPGTEPGVTTTVPPPVGTTTIAPPPPATTTFAPPPTTTATATTTVSTPPPPPPPPPTDERPDDKILIGGHNVKLISVAASGDSLDVRVDGRVYTVEPGATFDDNFKLVRIDGRCGRFLFGDQSFELCKA